MAVVGPTGMGKTKIVIKSVYDDIRLPNRPAVISLDPHDSLNHELALACTDLIKTGELLYDPIEHLDFGIGLGILEPSDNPNLRDREAENREIIGELKSAFSDEGRLNTQENPVINEGWNTILSLGIHQRQPIPATYLRDAFNFQSPVYQYLKANCTDERTREKCEFFEGLPKREFVTLCGPVNRRLEETFACLQLQARDVSTLKVCDHINRGGITLLSGNSTGKLSREDSSRVLKLWLRKIIRLLRSGKITRPLVIVIDEGTASGLLDPHVARALEETRKWGKGVQFVIIFQDQNRLEESVRAAVFSCCKQFIIFRQNHPDSAREFAEMIATRQLDPLRVKAIDYTTRQVEDGMEEVESTSTSRSGDRITKTTGKTLRPKKRNVQEEHITRMSLEEQIRLRQQELMNLGIGQYEVISEQFISTGPQYFSMLPLPWDSLTLPNGQPLNEFYLQQALDEQHRTNPVYRLKVIQYPKCGATNPKKENGKPNGTPKSGGNGKGKRSAL
jgi:hypothetical protein